MVERGNIFIETGNGKNHDKFNGFNMSIEEIFQIFPQAEISYDLRGRIFYWSVEAEKMYGYKVKEALGKDVVKFLSSPQLLDEIFKIISDNRWTVKSIELEIMRKKKDGSDIYVIATITPITDEEDERIGFLEINKDITLREEMVKKITEMVIVDDLTGLFKKRHLLDSLSKEIDRAKRYSRIFSVIFIDIDGFKNYNDRFGHIEGDKALRRLGEIIRNSIRHCDTAFRFGGEEFVILLPDTEIKSTMIVAERIKEGIQNEPFIPEKLSSKEQPINLTVSVGVAQYEKDDTVTSILEKADKAMYEGKKRGGNRIIVV